jgi:SAM-dependent methyltransferase
VDDTFRKRETRYRKFKEKNPDVAFSRYLMERQLDNLSAGSGALKVALASNEEFWASGEAKAARLMATAGIEPHHKVVEYGCGSLRIAAHFIRRLAPGNFFGLDVVSGFYEAGQAAIGDGLIAERRPRFGVIEETTLAEAEALAADFVYSAVVCAHVHPDEIETYFRNLVRLAHKPGAWLIFNAALHEHPVRYAFDGWAWPLEFYQDHLPGFDMIRALKGTMQTRNGIQTMPVDFEFRRPARHDAAGDQDRRHLRRFAPSEGDVGGAR